MVQDLKKFLIESNKAGYAGDLAPSKKEKDGSTTIEFELGDWRSNDNFYGGEPYGGRVIVFFKNRPFWIMLYYGKVYEHWTELEPVYAFLKRALMQMPEEFPFRGPRVLEETEFKYENQWNGTIENFSGTEVIYNKAKRIYKAKYMGGLVDQRK